jgi:hypothetical protein
VGLAVPIPTFPLESNLIASAPPSEKAMVSAAGKNIPVLVSPVVVIAGNAAVPAAKVDCDVNVGEAIVGEEERTFPPEPVTF